MGNSAKIRHRRRRREKLRRARSELVAGILADMVRAPLREHRRLPLGFVEVAPVDGVRQIVPSRSFETVVEEVVAERERDRGRSVDELDAALAQALRDLDPDSASGLKPDT